jgi:acyl carrier protein
MNTSQNLQYLVSKALKFKIPEDQITDSSQLVADFGMDSIAIVQLIVDIESEFDIELSDGDLELEKLTRFGTLRKLVDTKVAAAHQ